MPWSMAQRSEGFFLIHWSIKRTHWSVFFSLRHLRVAVLHINDSANVSSTYQTFILPLQASIELPDCPKHCYEKSRCGRDGAQACDQYLGMGEQIAAHHRWNVRGGCCEAGEERKAGKTFCGRRAT